MKNISEAIAVFGFGGIIYGLVEILFRGYTHWTMILTGGVVFAMLYHLNKKFCSSSIFLRSLIGCFIITAAEFIMGCILNIDLRMNIWNYSDEKFNLMGQICPLYSLGWFLICIPAAGISFILRKNISRKALF